MSETPALLIVPIILVLKHEISETAFDAHNLENEDLPFGIAVEDAAGTTDNLTIAIAFKFLWYFARIRVPFKTFDSGEQFLTEYAFCAVGIQNLQHQRDG